MAYLKLRTFGYTFRQTIPPDLRVTLGKTEFNFSLQTPSKLEAQQIAMMLSGQILNSFKQLRSAQDKDILSTICTELESKIHQILQSQRAKERLKTAPITPRCGPQKERPKLSTLYEKYEAEKIALNWGSKAADDYKTAFAALLDILGDIPINQLGHEQATKYVEKILNYPARRTLGVNSKKSLEELIASGVPNITARTAKNHVTRINTFFNWLKMKRYIPENYLSGLAPKGKQTSTKKEAFSKNELRTIFSTSPFKDDSRCTPWRYWVPILALYTGARLEEIAQLHASDVQIENDIYFIHIHDDGDNQLKNDSSKRVIPLHHDLIKLGFLNLVKEQEGKRLFNLNKVSGKYGKRVTNWFTKFKRGLGFSSSKVFHSFRHSFRDAAVEAGIPSEHVKALLGHAQKDITHGVYGSGFSLCLLNESLQRVDFKEVREVLL
ncbi:site-specific integrase [Zooshikella ganghwensis]|uniref:site-specific integrase n=1 Tax=Zooshikella ganghwensis TaxID=202772 RepID=UPI000415B6F9|nr:site-specific integrase [Zooshikella ganghwensis]